MTPEQLARRYACKSDLLNYFKKAELLGGLTKLEQEQLRFNIGINEYNNTGELGIISEITYSAMINLINTNQLLSGKKYLITDYQTIYSSNVFNSENKRISWGHSSSEHPSLIQKIIVSALSTNRIDPRIIILDPSTINWNIEYDITQETLEDGIKTKGKIIYLKDSNNNSAYYDFKNIKFRRTSLELSNSNLRISTPYVDLFTFSNFENGILEDSSYFNDTKNNNLKIGCFNNVFLGDTYNNTFSEDCSKNTFIRGCHDVNLGWNSFNNFFNEPVCFLSGSIYNKTFKIGNSDMSMSITKTIHKVNEATIISYLDPITYSHQIIIL